MRPLVRKSRKSVLSVVIIRPQRENNIPKEETPMKYVCDICGWEYDEALGCPEKGIAPGTPWSEVHDDFECPLCFVGKDQFSEA